MYRTIATTLLLTLATPALAADVKLCVVDAEQALNSTDEGKAAQSRLETMFAAKQDDLDKMQKQLEKEFADYESRKVILSEEAKRAQEQSLMEKQAAFQQAVMQAEQEMQQTYVELLKGMEEKLLKSAEALGAKQGCTLLLQKAAAVYVGPGVTDVTSDLIAQINAAGK